MTFRSAYAFLTGPEETGRDGDPSSFGRLGWGVLLLSVGWGLAAVGLWHGAYELFGRPSGDYTLMGLVVTAVMLLWPFRQAAKALSEFIAGKDLTVRMIASAVLVVTVTTALGVARPDWFRQEIYLAPWIRWLRPESKIDRVLLLMPLWGAWSMIILVHFRRPDPQLFPAGEAIRRSIGPLRSAIIMGLLMAVTIGYFAYLPWTQLSISLSAALAGVGGGLLLVGRRGRCDRQVLLASNLITQLVVLLAFLANRNLRFW